MAEYRNNIDELFYEGIEAHRELPANDVWKEVETELNKEAVTVYKKKYGKLKRSFAILLLLFMGFLLYDVFSDYVTGDNDTTAKQDSNPVIEKSKKAETQISVPAKTRINSKATIVSPGNLEPGKEAEIRANSDNHSEKVALKVAPVKRLAATKPLTNKITRVTPDQLNSNASIVPQKKTIISGNKSVSDIAFDRNEEGKAVLVDMKENSDVALNAVKAIESATPSSVIENGPTDNELVGNDEISFEAYPNRYINKENGLSAGLFGMPLIITNSDKGNLLNGLWPAAENLNEPSLLYIPETVMPKAPGRPAQKQRFFLSLNYTPYVSSNIFTDNKPSRFNNANSASTGAGSTGGGNQAQGMSGARRNEDFNFIRESESTMLVSSYGLNAGFWLSNRLYLQTGLNYSNLVTEIDPKYIFARDNGGNIGFDLHTTIGSSFLFPKNIGAISPVAGDSMMLSNSHNTARYLGVPITLGYKLLSSKRFSLETFAGGQYNILLRANTWGILNKGTSTQSYVSAEMTSLRPSYFSLLAGLNGELILGRHVSFVFSPTGQFALSYFNRGGFVSTRPNYFGLTGGMRFRF